MRKKLISWLLIIAGVLLIAVFLLADLIGIGSYPGINYAQIIGAAVGVVVFVIGVWYLIRKPKKEA
jgi:hypothetical protein